MIAKLLMAGTSLAGCGVAAAPHSPEVIPSIPLCSEVPGMENWGPGRVQIKWENELGCDLVPPQELILVIDERSWAAHSGSAEGWGGDASLAWATQELEDSGCRVVWHNGQWAEGQDCDF